MQPFKINFLRNQESKSVLKLYRFLLKLKIKLQGIWFFLEKENFINLLLIIAVILFASSLGLYLVEPNLTLFDSFWWAIVTLTTVGYGDIIPKTTIGKLIGVFNMMVGVGVLTIFSANIASILVNSRIREDLGMNSYHFQDHIIICEWNQQAKIIIKELRHQEKIREKPIILIAPIERKPLDDPHLFFVSGEVSDDTLAKANLSEAKTVIILGDEKLDYHSRDAKVILNTLTVESINRKAYTIVELADETYVPTCKRANADEIIVSSNLSSKLISNATINHGMSNVITDILSQEYGSQLYKVLIPFSEIGCTFLELFIYMKQVYHSTIIAIQKGSKGEVISNPNNDYLMEENDYLILIAACKTSISSLQKKLFSHQIN